MEKKTRLLVFFVAGVIVVISCLLIVAALVTNKRVQNMGEQMREQFQTTDAMPEEQAIPQQFPELREGADGASP